MSDDESTDASDFTASTSSFNPTSESESSGSDSTNRRKRQGKKKKDAR